MSKLNKSKNIIKRKDVFYKQYPEIKRALDLFNISKEQYQEALRTEDNHTIKSTTTTNN